MSKVKAETIVLWLCVAVIVITGLAPITHPDVVAATTNLMVEAGKFYQLTATWDGQQLALK